VEGIEVSVQAMVQFRVSYIAHKSHTVYDKSLSFSAGLSPIAALARRKHLGSGMAGRKTFFGPRPKLSVWLPDRDYKANAIAIWSYGGQ